MMQYIFFFLAFVSQIFIMSCGGDDKAAAHIDLSPCEQAFNYNRTVDTANSTIPYMKTCGLTCDTTKHIFDVYARDISVDQAFVDAVYDELEILDKVLVENKIPYTILAGTLLGAIRNGGLIPNDDDVDIGLDVASENQLVGLTSQFEKEGYSLEANDFLGYKLHKKSFRTNGLDIFLLGKRTVNNTDVLHYARDSSFNTWPKEYFDVDALKNLTLIPFGHLTVSSVSVPKGVAYCDRAWGPDWYTATYKSFDHVTGKKVDSKKMKLLPTEYYYLVHSSTLKSKP